MTMTKKKKNKLVNLIYIKAAVQEHTGISVSLPRLKRMLIEEGLVQDIEILPHYQALDSSSPTFDLKLYDSITVEAIDDESVTNIVEKEPVE